MSLIAALLLAQAAAQPNFVAGFGDGRNSCAKAFSPPQYQASFAWVMGYFTGINYAVNGPTGHSTDGDGIMGEIKLVCDARPSLTLQAAANEVFQKMRAERR